MAEQATVEPDDIDAIIAMLKETGGPLPLDVLVERYVARLKERMSKDTDHMSVNA